MSLLTCTQTGQSIFLTQQIAKSGEGEVWRTNMTGFLAKVYYSPDERRMGKLAVMVANPPTDPNAGIHHISFAWPRSLLQDTDGRMVGFLMPTIAHSVQLLDVYNPQRRQKVLPGFNWLYLHTTALNIASIVWAIHLAGYVLGDIKPENILVNNRALPAVIDTDSFQVRHPQTGEVYRCPVGSEGFTPVELLGQDLAAIEQTEVHDRFRLGVIIYLLLFGDHPFKGKWIGEGDSPLPIDLLRQGFWPYAPDSLIQPGPVTMPLEIVHPALQQCFLRCFNEGHTQPMQRPTPEDWVNALKAARASLQACPKVKSHWYSQSYGKCYWCERQATLGVDIFPAVPPIVNHPIAQAWHPIRKAAERMQQAVSKQFSEQRLTTAIQIAKLPKNWSSVRRSGTHALVEIQANLRQMGDRLTPLTLPALPSLPSPQTWIQLGSTIVAIVGGFALLMFLSRTKIDTQDLELSTFGIVLCLGLVMLCFLWIKWFDRDTPER
ncbi:MAG: hypothetical protein KME16_02230 [Scytolyngbya sp. HA4215-MV1]|nr:hypothetical protein [Scytolyngbya sp. HA4215-MV1]